MSVKVNNKDIADVKVGDGQISSIYAGDVLIWESGYPNFYGKINWESSPFSIQKYRGYLVKKADYNFKLEGRNTVYSFDATRSDVILAVYELVINAMYLDINYDNGSAGLDCFTNLEKVTFTSPFRKQNLNLYYSFYLPNCKEINGLDFGKSVITNCVGAFSQLNLINNDWSFLTTAFFRPTSCQFAFDHSNVENIDMTETWDMTDCTSLYFAFSYCGSLTTIKGLKLSEKCTSFHHTFFACDSLVSLLDTKWHGKINSGQSMFFNCSALVDAGDFSDVTFVNSDCSFMFNSCRSLASFVSFKGSVSTVQSLFNGCAELTDVDLSNLTLNNANCSNMFIGCSSLTSPITLKGSISNASNMFSGCTNLTDINLSNVDFSNCTNMLDMFYNCSNLENVDLSNIDFSNCTNMAGMFQSCKLNTNFEFILTGKNLTNLLSIGSMFNRRVLPKIKKVDLSGNTWRSEGVDCTQLFRWGDCETVDLRGIKCAGSLQYAFYQNTIDYLDLRGFDTANVTNMTLITSIAIEPYEVKIDSSFFNSNISVFPLAGWFQLSYRDGVFTRSSREQEIAKLNMLFDALINHPKVNDDDWEGQEINIGANLNNAALPTGLLNPNCPYKDQTLIDKMNNAIDLGWTISFV